MKKLLFFIITIIIGFLAGAIVVWNYLDKVIERIQQLSDKHLKLFKIMNLWVNNYQDDKHLEQYLLDKGIKKIAIYGMGIAGTTLYRELKSAKVEVCYGIDQLAKRINGIKVLSINDQLPEVDAVIVTPVIGFNDISMSLEQKLKCVVMSLEEIIFYM